MADQLPMAEDAEGQLGVDVGGALPVVESLVPLLAERGRQVQPGFLAQRDVAGSRDSIASVAVGAVVAIVSVAGVVLTFCLQTEVEHHSPAAVHGTGIVGQHRGAAVVVVEIVAGDARIDAVTQRRRPAQVGGKAMAHYRQRARRLIDAVVVEGERVEEGIARALRELQVADRLVVATDTIVDPRISHPQLQRSVRRRCEAQPGANAILVDVVVAEQRRERPAKGGRVVTSRGAGQQPPAIRQPQVGIGGDAADFDVIRIAVQRGCQADRGEQRQAHRLGEVDGVLVVRLDRQHGGQRRQGLVWPFSLSQDQRLGPGVVIVARVGRIQRRVERQRGIAAFGPGQHPCMQRDGFLVIGAEPGQRVVRLRVVAKPGEETRPIEPCGMVVRVLGEIGVDPAQRLAGAPGPGSVQRRLIGDGVLRERRLQGQGASERAGEQAGSTQRRGAGRCPTAGGHLRHLRFPVIHRSMANWPIVRISVSIRK